MITDGQFCQWSPDGQYVACGSAVLTVARVASITGSVVTLDQITEVGEGNLPAWWQPTGTPTPQLVYYNRGTSLMVVNTPPPFVAAAFASVPGFNSFGAGGSVWEGYRVPTVQFDNGAVVSGRLDIPCGPVVDQNGRAIFLSPETNVLYARTPLGAVSTVDTNANGIFRPHVATSGLAWGRFEGSRIVTHGNRGSGIERIHVVAGSEFWVIPIDTAVGPWLLAHDDSQLYLRAWGRTTITQVTTGVTNYPHAVYSAPLGGFLVAWADGGGVLQTTFVALDVTAVEAPGTPAPIPGGGGSGSGPGGSTAPGAGDLVVVPPKRFTPGRRPIYPHVKEVTDPAASQSLKLLWDRMHALGERLDTGDIAQRFAGLDQTLTDTQTQIARQAQQLTQNPAEANATQIPGGVGEPGGEPPGVPGGDPEPPGPGTGTCADSPGTGHFDPGGPLTVERARKISCGTGDEWSALRVATASSAERDSNMELLLLRIIWHLNQGGFSAGRQRNPSTAISKDKLTVVIGGETRAFDVFIDASSFSKPLVMQWFETFPADMVADAGIAD